MSGLEEDDDYMSSGFLEKIFDVKPGVSQNRAHKRSAMINARNEEAFERERSKITRRNKDEIARSRLEEAITQPISSESKGFKLLAKMGYKPGMSLGVNRDGSKEGIKEPISLNFKIDRKGIGTDVKAKQEVLNLSEPVDIVFEYRVQNYINFFQETRISEYRSTRKMQANKRSLISDLIKLRKACHELDFRICKEQPEKEWFWPIYKMSSANSDHYYDGAKMRAKQLRPEVSYNSVPDDSLSFVYPNGLLAPDDVDYQNSDEEKIFQILSEVVKYLRITHHYCGYCGSIFDSQEDIEVNCPGPFKDDHDAG